MLFIAEKVENEEIKTINNFFEAFENEEAAVSPEEVNEKVSKYITSLVSGIYNKSVEDIANTNVGNKIIRKRNLQQVMRESFFYGANRFGNNFIA